MINLKQYNEQVNEEKEMKDFLRDKLDGITIKLNDKYPDVDFYQKDGKILLEVYKIFPGKNNCIAGKCNYIYVNYDEIWSVFINKYKMKHFDIQDFLKNELEEILKLKHINPISKREYLNRWWEELS